eukprot:1369182-Rhodomonas_salina.2
MPVRFGIPTATGSGSTTTSIAQYRFVSGTTTTSHRPDLPGIPVLIAGVHECVPGYALCAAVPGDRYTRVPGGPGNLTGLPAGIQRSTRVGIC